jgi:hypothetical protein
MRVNSALVYGLIARGNGGPGRPAVHWLRFEEEVNWPVRGSCAVSLFEQELRFECFDELLQRSGVDSDSVSSHMGLDQWRSSRLAAGIRWYVL